MKRFIGIALTATMLFAASGCSSSTGNTEATTEADSAVEATTEAAEGETTADAEGTLPTLSQDTIIIGLDDELPPMGFRDENNEIVGFDIDLAKAAAERLGVEVEFQPIDWAAKEIELESGKIDALWNGLTITDERKETMDITDPYLKNRQVIVVKTDSDIQSKADLAGKVVGLQDGSSAVDAVNADELASAMELTTYDTNILALSDLDIGRVDAVVADETFVGYYMSQNENDFRVIEDGDFGEEYYGIAVKKGNTELLTAIQAALDELDEDALVRILVEPHNSLVKQYEAMLNFDKVKLTFTENALHAVAKLAIKRKTGARGLRSILEDAMLDVMYKIPSEAGSIKECIINEEVITEGAEPILVRNDELPDAETNDNKETA